ncbi:MAG: uracil-DNA glycosylase family protein, partial [Nanoarchaeota archaeon]
MMQKNELIKYNEQTFVNLKNENNDLQLGFFKNNFILFVGQNPGNPFNDKTRELTQNVITEREFKDFEIEYFNNIYNSIMGDFLKSLVGESWNHISFTNIVKVPTLDNSEPSQELIDNFFPITKKQINLLQPNLVVLIGKFAGKQFGIENFYEFKKIDNIDYFLIPHPSYINRLDVKEREDIIWKIKMYIDGWLKYNAIIKVTKFEVFYRNISFLKKSFFHNEKSDFCFIECEENSKYKSFNGKNLKKIVKKYNDN